MKYRTKHPEVEATQMSAATRLKLVEWVNGRPVPKDDSNCNWIVEKYVKAWFYPSNAEDEAYVDTIDGPEPIWDGDWLVKLREGFVRMPDSKFQTEFEKAPSE